MVEGTDPSGREREQNPGFFARDEIMVPAVKAAAGDMYGPFGTERMRRLERVLPCESGGSIR